MRALITFILLLAPDFISQRSLLDARERLIVWNVGQGLWTTWVTPQACIHFDMGGEFAPWPRIRETCGHRENLAVFSHWDWDHIGFARRARRNFEKLCILSMPRGRPTPYKQKYLSELPPCDAFGKATIPKGAVVELTPQASNRSSANSLSRILVLRGLALLPGDSTSKEERSWGPSLDRFAVRFALLGHHGSRTSTSQALLKRLPRLKQAVASARKARYGHPHPSVSNRLRKNGIALLSTEDWGTIHWEVPRLRSRLTDDTGGIPCSSCERPARSKHSRRIH